MVKTATWDPSAAAASSDVAALAWKIAENGVLAGMIGATTVAVWFFALDLVTRGVPFYTPSLLGSIVFAGLRPEEVTGENGAAIFAYTGLHGVLFLGAGTAIAWMFAEFERNPQVGLVLLLLFVTLEAILWGVGVSIVPALAGVVGAWAILVANVGSAAAMFAFLLRRHPCAVERLRQAWHD
ncbi:MAG TPA: hypothetical protein VFD84_18225 [Candidatus Binatia bacterium]|jgi:hypothetical protein|nr:hypothetical protein [Candidatus Binatia bacterium]